MAGKYAPLQEYLSKLPKSQMVVTLRFADLEKILAAKLPKSASDYQEWWANQSHGPQAASWQNAGFIVSSIHPKRKIVEFSRGLPTTRGAGRKSIATRTAYPKKQITKKGETRKALAAKVLLKAGFKLIADWQLVDGQIRLSKEVTNERSVYAHVVDDAVVYIGSATIGLRKRMKNYVKPGLTQTTSIRIKKLLQEQLSDGRAVQLIAAFPVPGDWNGLPVDMVLGIEGGLIKKYKPLWNKQGA